MKVKYIKGSGLFVEKKDPLLSTTVRGNMVSVLKADNIYEVVREYEDSYVVIDELGREWGYFKHNFEIV